MILHFPASTTLPEDYVFQYCSDSFFSHIPTIVENNNWLEFAYPIPLTQHQKLYIRSSYKVIAKNALLKANPNHCKEPAIYFDGNSTFEYPQYPLSSDHQFWTFDLWCLVDSKDPTNIPGFPVDACSVILSTTPRSGVPRLVLEQTEQDPTSILISACKQCELEDCIKLVSIHSEITPKAKIIQTLVHLKSSPPYKDATVIYASETAMKTIAHTKWTYESGTFQCQELVSGRKSLKSEDVKRYYNWIITNNIHDNSSGNLYEIPDDWMRSTSNNRKISNNEQSKVDSYYGSTSIEPSLAFVNQKIDNILQNTTNITLGTDGWTNPNGSNLWNFM
ncbi:24586_t:CDS:2, partial [Entrophospora sp. SA101]